MFPFKFSVKDDCQQLRVERSMVKRAERFGSDHEMMD